MRSVPPPPERWQEIDQLLAAALERPAAEREAFLAEASRGDPELRREVQALLQSSAEAEGMLGESATSFAAPLLTALRSDSGDDERTRAAGERLGPYRILEEIGRGGMGAVYLADRADDEFEQRVAIKLVKRGMDTDEVLRRFRYERQILASLEHPNIARLYDGGVSDDGRPYLVMEYIEGRPITAYCDAHRLGTDARLGLFRTVCQAVQYAHQKLVVHRDIKPSNILVTEQGSVKLLDFGIAKLLGSEAQPAAPLTRTEVRLLTPEYASPEQFRGMPVTTASDVYALGVVLYELLTSRRPFDRTAMRALGAEQPALEREPERPSAIVARRVEEAAGRAPGGALTPDAIAEARGTTVDRLQRRLRGDLDTITLKALAPEPERRYHSVEQLLEDVRRHVQGLPVAARPATVAYRARKYVRRHRVGVAMGVTFALLVATLALLHNARITRERDRAQLEADKARASIEFMVELFEGADPDEALGDTLTVFQLLERGATRMEHALARQPAVRATVQNVLGKLYVKLGDYQRALPLLEGALATRRALYGDEHEEIAQTHRDLADLLSRKGDYGAADSMFRRALASGRQRLGNEDPGVAAILNEWGNMLAYSGKYEEAEPLFQEALRILTKLAGDYRKEIAASKYGLATLRFRAGEHDQAEALFREVLATRRQLYGDLHNQVIDALEDLGNTLYEKAEYTAAERHLREALEKRRKLLGPDHPAVSTALNNLALVPSTLGDYERADSMLRESLSIVEKLVGREHRDFGMTLSNIGWLSLRKGDLETAEAQFREALGIMQRASGKESDDAGLLLGNLALVLQRKRAYGEAERLYREALAVRTKVHGAESMQVAWRKYALAELLREARRYGEAERLHGESLALRQKLQGEEGPDVARGLYGLARVLCDRRRHAESDSLFRMALTMYRKLQGEEDEWVAQTKATLGACLVAQTRYADAEPLLVDGYVRLAQGSADRWPVAREALGHLVTLYTAWGKPEKAAEYRKLLADTAAAARRSGSR
jgi:serine/threonine-protein kinase